MILWTAIRLHSTVCSLQCTLQLDILEFEYFPFGSFGSDPGFQQLLRAYFRSKRAKREVYELDPPLLGPQPRILGRSI